MKIAMVVERFPPDIGGSGVRFCRIAERLSRYHSLDVITLGNPTSQDSATNFHVHHFDPDRLPLPRYWGMNRVIGLSLAAFARILHSSYDLVDVDIWPLLPFFSAKLSRPRMPLVVSWNVVWPFSFSKTISRVSNIFANRISKLSSYNVTVSKLAKTLLLNHSSISPERISVIPNGIDEEFLLARVEPQWGRMIFVGRLEPQKRLDLLIKAFRIIKEKMSDAELHIIGSGPLYPKLLQISREVRGLYLHNSIPSNNREDLISQLSRSWVFISASEYETYGLSMAESLSLGLPVIVTETPYNGALNEIVKHDCNSLVVEHNKPEALAEAVERLYNDQELWKKLSCYARNSTPFHSWDEVAEKTETVYRIVSGNQTVE